MFVTPADKLMDKTFSLFACADGLSCKKLHGGLSQQVGEIKIMDIISSPLGVIAWCPAFTPHCSQLRSR